MFPSFLSAESVYILQVDNPIMWGCFVVLIAHTKRGTTHRIQFIPDITWSGLERIMKFYIGITLSLFCSLSLSVNIYLGYFSLLPDKIVYHLFITKFCPAPAAPAVVEVFQPNRLTTNPVLVSINGQDRSS